MGISPANTADSSELPTRTRYVVLTWLCVAASIAYLQRNCIGVAESTIRADLNLTKEQTGWLMSGFFWSYAFFQIPSGWLGDRFGSRRMLPAYSGAWSLATILTGLAGSVVTVWLASFSSVAGAAVLTAWVWLMFSRVLSGAAQAGIFPCSAVIVSQWFPRTRRAFSTGWLACFMQVGGLAATFLTGYLLVQMDWRWVFALFALPGFFWSVLFYRWFRDSPAEHPQVNAAELKLIAAGQPKILVSSKETVPTPWLALVTSPAMWCIGGQQFCRAFSYIFYATWFPTFLQETRGVSILDSGILTSLPLLGAFFGAPLGGILSDWILVRTGSHRLARQGLAVLFLSGSALFIVTAYFVHDATPAVLVISAGAFCAALAGPIAYATTVDMGGQHVATVFGTMNMSGNFGAALFPIVVPLLLGDTTGGKPGNWDLVFFTFAGVYGVAALFWLILKPQGTIFEQSPFGRNQPATD